MLEAGIMAAGWVAPRTELPPTNPESIFILRNNDIGDVLVITPLFEALKRRFPWTRICAGVGRWSRDVLVGNPYVDEIITVNAPWHNHPLGHISTASIFRYLASSEDIHTLRQRKFPVGIDVLGSGFGMALLMRAGVPYRLGMQGYAGGHTGAQKTIRYDAQEHVARMAMRFAEALGSSQLPEPRPQIFLTPEELGDAEKRWRSLVPDPNVNRVIVTPCAGLSAKVWPGDSYAALLPRLAKQRSSFFIFTGVAAEKAFIEKIASSSIAFANLAGETSLRQSIALAAKADWVLASPSMMMHAAAAFRVPTIVLLGNAYDSNQNHARQWGYSGPWWSFGKDYGRQTLPSVEEVEMGVVKLWNENHTSPRKTNGY